MVLVKPVLWLSNLSCNGCAAVVLVVIHTLANMLFRQAISLSAVTANVDAANLTWRELMQLSSAKIKPDAGVRSTCHVTTVLDVFCCRA